MTTLDWAIIGVLVISVLQGIRRGLIVALLSLAGIVAGIFLAARYWHVAMPLARRFISAAWAAQFVSYFVVALLVFLVFTLVARLLRRAARAIGLGWLDRVLGGVFGLLRGVLMVVLGFIIVAAFFPQLFLAMNSRLAPYFLSAAQTVTRGAPSAAANKIVSGLQHGPRSGQR